MPGYDRHRAQSLVHRVFCWRIKRKFAATLAAFEVRFQTPRLYRGRAPPCDAAKDQLIADLGQRGCAVRTQKYQDLWPCAQLRTPRNILSPIQKFFWNPATASRRI